MTEILTESFCERCGTRYTFESARPKTRLKGVKVLSRGLKNFVLSDDTSMDEAMAAARNETDREQTSHQLDAFHKTFNFCMSCRQYTCPNCWNEVEARCLSCAPNLGHEVLPAAFPDLPSGPLVADPAAYVAGPAAYLTDPGAANGTNGTNGASHGAELIGMAEVQARRDDEVDAAARLAALTAAPTPVAEPEPLPSPEPETVVESPAAAAAPVGEPAAAARVDGPSPYDDVDASTPTWLKALVVGSQADDSPAAEPPAVVKPVAPPAVVEPVAPMAPLPVAEAAPAPIEPEPVAFVAEPEAAALAASAAVADEPAALVDIQAPPADTKPIAPEPVQAAPVAPPARSEPISAPAPPVVDAAPQPRTPVAPVPVVAEPTPAPVQPAAPAAPDLVTAASAETATPAADVVRQPVWQMIAPDEGTAPADGAAAGRPEPQWPTRPEWPDRTPAGGLPFLNRPATPTGGVDALWAESTREVVATPSTNGRPANVVQPCVSCGLSLSANARFCRRCGTPQGS